MLDRGEYKHPKLEAALRMYKRLPHIPFRTDDEQRFGRDPLVLDGLKPASFCRVLTDEGSYLFAVDRVLTYIMPESIVPGQSANEWGYLCPKSQVITSNRDLKFEGGKLQVGHTLYVPTIRRQSGLRGLIDLFKETPGEITFKREVIEDIFLDETRFK